MQEKKHNTVTIFSSLIWNFLEKCGVQIIQLVVSILIARILTPHDYGLIALVTIFISIANVFVQSGLSTAIIQKKDTDELDYSSVFWYSILVAFLLYLLFFMLAEWISTFYAIPDLVSVIRVMSLMLFPGALNSIQVAILSKRMQFKKQFLSGLISVICSSIVGISLAILNYGPWALVFQQLTYQVLSCVILLFLIDWYPKLKFSFYRTKKLLSYGCNLLFAKLIDTVYHNMESLIIGKIFSTDILAFCNKGKQFPLTLIDNIDGSIQSVMLPAFSLKQDDKIAVKLLLRKTVSISTYISFTVMAILASIATPMVEILLGSKWLESVPFLQLFCLVTMMFPLQTANLQAINAIGRSDIYLKLMIIKRFMGIFILFFSILFYKSPFTIIVAALFVEILGIVVNIPSNAKLLDYHFSEQLEDILPNILIALSVGIPTFLITYLKCCNMILVSLQLIISAFSFVFFSYLFKNKNFTYLRSLLLSFFGK